MPSTPSDAKPETVGCKQNKNLQNDLDGLNNYPEYLGGFWGIKFTDWSENSLTATMPINEKTRQPFGILHGGASVVLAETIGTFASSLVIDANEFVCVGLEINANHLRPVSSGEVRGVCCPKIKGLICTKYFRRLV